MFALILLGVEVFTFAFTKKGFVPIGRQGTPSYGSFEQYCNPENASVSADAQGRGCAAWVIFNGNMDYLHCNDLSWSGKHKCSK